MSSNPLHTHVLRNASLVLAVTAALVTGMLYFDENPADAQTARNCRGSVRDNIANGSCNRGGRGGPKRFPLDPNFEFVDQTTTPCIDKNGTPSHIGRSRDIRTGEITEPHCLTQANGTGTGNAITGIAQNLVANPKITPDFEGDFLVGAPVKFTATGLDDQAVPVPNFPGVSLVLTPVTATWNFGDGTTSADLEPTHIYENIAPNTANLDNHAVTVTMTANYTATLLDTNTGTNTNLGAVTGNGNLNRNIVQVWSKQVEPNS